MIRPLQLQLPLALLLALLLPTRAGARPAENLRLEAATTAPLYIGAGLGAELPWRLRLSTAVGVLPHAYVEGINDLGEAFDGYEERVAQVVEDSLTSSLVWRTHLGWRPFADAGFYFEAGYGLVALGGGTSEATLIALALDLELPPHPPRARYDVDATLHMLDAEVGWEFWILDRISIRAGLGGATTLDAKASIEPRGRRIPIVGAIFERMAERELERILERYVHTPTLSLAVGVRLL